MLQYNFNAWQDSVNSTIFLKNISGAHVDGWTNKYVNSPRIIASFYVRM